MLLEKIGGTARYLGSLPKIRRTLHKHERDAERGEQRASGRL